MPFLLEFLLAGAAALLKLAFEKGVTQFCCFFGKVVLQCLIAILGVLPLTNSIEPNGTSGRPFAISIFRYG